MARHLGEAGTTPRPLRAVPSPGLLPLAEGRLGAEAHPPPGLHSARRGPPRKLCE